LGAVVIYFRREVLLLLASPFRRDPEAGRYRRFLWLILLASVPTALIGLTLKDAVEAWMLDMRIVAMLLGLTGVLVFFGERFHRGGRGEAALTAGDALATGVAQGLAVLPGLSRSGSTIATLLFKGVDGETAARFSFLMSLPAIAGAALLSLRHAGAVPPADIPAYLAGAVSAFVVGLFAIHFLLGLIRQRRLVWFAVYCWALALGLLAANL